MKEQIKQAAENLIPYNPEYGKLSQGNVPIERIRFTQGAEWMLNTLAGSEGDVKFKPFTPDVISKDFVLKCPDRDEYSGLFDAIMSNVNIQLKALVAKDVFDKVWTCSLFPERISQAVLRLFEHHLKEHTASAVAKAVGEKWVSVDDRMPENIGTYLCYTNDGQTVVCNVAVNGWWRLAINSGSYSDLGEDFVRDSEFIEREVTHWMELPQSPLPSPPTQK